jgi:hypothetical protein
VIGRRRLSVWSSRAAAGRVAVAGVYSVERACLGLVRLADRDDLSVAGVESEPELAGRVVDGRSGAGGFRMGLRRYRRAAAWLYVAVQ